MHLKSYHKHYKDFKCFRNLFTNTTKALNVLESYKGYINTTKVLNERRSLSLTQQRLRYKIVLACILSTSSKF